MDDSIFDKLAGAICLGAFAVAFLLGFSMGRDSAAGHCERLGAFSHNEKVFECKVKV